MISVTDYFVTFCPIFVIVEHGFVVTALELGLWVLQALRPAPGLQPLKILLGGAGGKRAYQQPSDEDTRWHVRQRAVLRTLHRTRLPARGVHRVPGLSRRVPSQSSPDDVPGTNRPERC